MISLPQELYAVKFAAAIPNSFQKQQDVPRTELETGITTLIDWYNPRIPGLPRNRQEKEQVVLFGGWPGTPKISLALVQP